MHKPAAEIVADLLQLELRLLTMICHHVYLPPPNKSKTSLGTWCEEED